MIWDEFLRHFCFCDEEDSGLSDEEQERKGPKNHPKHTRKRIHQAKKNFLEKFKTASHFDLSSRVSDKIVSLQASISHLGVEVAPQMPMERACCSKLPSISSGWSMR